MAMKMPEISSCEATSCAYNRDQQCHALAITVGGAEACACCDTYLSSSEKGGAVDFTGGVGACKVDRCVFNTLFECSAPQVKVGLHEGHADCRSMRTL